jgi:adenylate kinase
MDRGELVPDDVVVAIIADRIGQPDAKRGFVLDGFPRTVPQAEALDRLLAERGLSLDGVIELKVDEGILLERIKKRVAQMTARGEKIRADDTPDVLKGRLATYRAQTAPLVDYYATKGMLKSVDGMASVGSVTAAIDGLLAPRKMKAARKSAPSMTRKSKTRKSKTRKSKTRKSKTRKSVVKIKASKGRSKKSKKGRAKVAKAQPPSGRRASAGGDKGINSRATRKGAAASRSAHARSRRSRTTRRLTRGR